MRMRVGYFLSAVLLGSVAIAAGAPAELPVAITSSSVEAAGELPSGKGSPRFELHNQGARAILALGVRYDVTVPDGRSEPNASAIDAAHTLASYRDFDMRPGGHATLRTGLVVPLDAAVTAARVTFVIFDDDTALGDDKEIARIFEGRRARSPFWHRMDAIFTEATTQESDPLRVFEVIRPKMESEGEKFKAANVGWYGEILARMTPRRMELTHTTPQYILETLRATIAEQKALCDQHLERRY